MASTEGTDTHDYAAVLVLVASTAAPDAHPVYEETVVLLPASSSQEARRQAHAHGRRQETGYLNGQGETVTWTLLEVVDVAPVLEEENLTLVHDEQAGPGVEVYYRYFRDYAAYRRFEPLLDGEAL
jgi:hypothetical protein